MNMRPTSLQCDRIKRILYEEWPPDYLKKPKPGNIYVLPGVIGSAGGMLCINKNGEYLSLTADQIFRGAKIAWPDITASFYLQIEGNELKIQQIEVK